MANINWELVVQLIGYLISGLVALFVASRQHSKTAALMEYRLQKLEEAVNKHNNLVERMTAVETKINMYHKGGANGTK